MTTYFVKTATITGGSAPNDGNDGKDPIGFGLATATYNDATKTLTQTNAFTTYTFTTGDQIAITGGTNATPGLYTIASKVDASNITLTTSAGSTDATGDWTSSNGPWATIQFAVDTIVAGDTCVFCADAEHTVNIIRMNTANAGSIASNVLYTGGTARGVVDGTRCTIDPSAGTIGFYDDNQAQSFGYTTFQYINIDGKDTTQSGIYGGSTHNGFCIKDCNVFDCTQHGLYISNVSFLAAVIRCDIYGNGGGGAHGGIIGGNTRRGQLVLVDSSVHDNDGVGVSTTYNTIFNSLIYDNTGNGVAPQLSNGTATTVISHSVIDGNGGDGYLSAVTTGAERLYLCENIISNNGGYGVNMASDNFMNGAIIGPNYYYNNTAGEVSLDGVAEDTIAEIEKHNTISGQDTDPNFTSVVDGSEDYTPASKDPVFSAGERGSTIPNGVSSSRQPYCGAVAPDLTAGGDGAGGGGYIIGG